MNRKPVSVQTRTFRAGEVIFREGDAREYRAAPGIAEAEKRQREQHERRHGQLRGAETENRPAHGEEPRQLQLEADDEQQHHHAEFGDGEDGGGIAEEREHAGPDDDADGEIADDRRHAEIARGRRRRDRGAEKDQHLQEQAEFAAVGKHGTRFTRLPRALVYCIFTEGRATAIPA